MSNVVKTIFEGDAKKLDSTINRSGKSIKSFETKTIGAFGRIKKSITGATSSIGGLATKMGLVVSAYAALGSMKEIVAFEGNLTRLAIQGGLTKKGMFALKKELLGISDATGQNPEALLTGINAIVERTGNIKFAVDTVKQLGIVASATGANVEEIGATASNLQEKFGIAQKDIMGVFDILSAQGKAGAFTLQNMASLFERLLSAAGRFDIKGVEGIRKFGAFLQIARRGTGSSEQAATAVERTVADLIQNASKVKAITKFSIFDEAKSKKEGRAVMKEFDVVLKEIITRTKGDTVKLQKIFGEEAIRGVTPLAQSYQKFGDFREFNQFIGLGGDGAMIMKDFDFWMTGIAAQTEKVSITWDKIKNTVWDVMMAPAKLMDQKLPGMSKYLADKTGIGGVASFSPIQVQNTNNIDIHIDDASRVTTNADNLNTKTNVKVKRGKF